MSTRRSGGGGSSRRRRRRRHPLLLVAALSAAAATAGGASTATAAATAAEVEDEKSVGRFDDFPPSREEEEAAMVVSDTPRGPSGVPAMSGGEGEDRRKEERRQKRRRRRRERRRRRRRAARREAEGEEEEEEAAAAAGFSFDETELRDALRRTRRDLQVVTNPNSRIDAFDEFIIVSALSSGFYYDVALFYCAGIRAGEPQNIFGRESRPQFIVLRDCFDSDEEDIVWGYLDEEDDDIVPEGAENTPVLIRRNNVADVSEGGGTNIDSWYSYWMSVDHQEEDRLGARTFRKGSPLYIDRRTIFDLDETDFQPFNFLVGSEGDSTWRPDPMLVGAGGYRQPYCAVTEAKSSRKLYNSRVVLDRCAEKPNSEQRMRQTWAFCGNTLDCETVDDVAPGFTIVLSNRDNNNAEIGRYNARVREGGEAPNSNWATCAFDESNIADADDGDISHWSAEFDLESLGLPDTIDSVRVTFDITTSCDGSSLQAIPRSGEIADEADAVAQQEQLREKRQRQRERRRRRRRRKKQRRQGKRQGGGVARRRRNEEKEARSFPWQQQRLRRQQRQRRRQQRRRLQTGDEFDIQTVFRLYEIRDSTACPISGLTDCISFQDADDGRERRTNIQLPATLRGDSLYFIYATSLVTEERCDTEEELNCYV